ncbi:MAG: zeta toxin family protein [Idiomarina sp.]|nr:zeta toxin family protein [Idiomarina sp.]
MNHNSTLNSTEERIAQNALEFARKNRQQIAKLIVDVTKYRREESPVSVFMAGSPGAGKTEASKALIDRRKAQLEVVRIDPDELRDKLPGYDGTNSYLFQPGVSILIERILDRAYKKDINFILDGTFANIEIARKNITRSIRHKRIIQILYVYQSPIVAWKFTQERERKEGRNIPLEAFIDQYFGARKVVNQLKEEFGKQLSVDVIIKHQGNGARSYHQGVSSIDSHVPENYTEQSLFGALSKLKGEE